MWSQVVYASQPPSPRWSACSFVYDDHIFVFGGEGVDMMYNDLYCFDPCSRKWEQLEYAPDSEAPPSPRFGACGAIRGDLFWLFGGFDGKNYLADLHVLHVQDRKWLKATIKSKGTVPNFPRCAHAVVSTPSGIAIFGGSNSTGAMRNGIYLNLRDQWDESISLRAITISFVQRFPNGETYTNHLRKGLAATSEGNIIYVVGGFDGRAHHLDVTATVLDTQNLPNERACIMVSSKLDLKNTTQPAGRRGHSVALHDKQLYVFGGGDGWNFFNDLVCIDLADNNMHVIAPRAGESVPSPRQYHSVLAFADRMVVFGGSGHSVFNDMFEYRFDKHELDPDPESILLGADLARFVGIEHLSDVFIVCRGKERVPAHRVVLAARSPHFNAMLSSGMREATAGEIHMPEVGHEALLEFLRFLYTDQPIVQPELAFEVYLLADLHNMEKFRKICLRSFASSLSVENAAIMLEQAHDHRSAEMKRICMDFIRKHFSSVMVTEDFSRLPEDVLAEVLREAAQNLRIIDQGNPAILPGRPDQRDR